MNRKVTTKRATATTCPPAVKRLFIYNVLVGLSLAIVSNFTFIDRLLMRIGIDFSSFGLIKSIIFLLPAIIYQFFAPYLARLGKESRVIAVSYLLRCLLPLGLPVAAMIWSNTVALSVICIICLPCGMFFAAVANNTLMKLYRMVIPQKNSNILLSIMNMLLGAPGLLLALPFSMILDRFDGLDDYGYFILFTFLQLITVLFEIPAVACIWNLKTEKDDDAEEKPKHKTNMLAPYRDRIFRQIAIISFLRSAACGMTMAYITVFLLEIMHFPLAVISLIFLILNILLYIVFPFGGKLMDNFGYGRVFIVLSGAMCAGLALLCLFWGQIWVIPFFALFMWDGTQSLCGGIFQQGIYSASTNLAAKEWIDEAVAAYSLTTNGGQFAGLLTASGLYWCITRCVPDGNVNEILQRYYLAVIPFFLIIFLLSALLAHDLKKIKK